MKRHGAGYGANPIPACWCIGGALRRIHQANQHIDALCYEVVYMTSTQQQAVLQTNTTLEHHAVKPVHAHAQ